jgi:SAM-dependent methyltransferase
MFSKKDSAQINLAAFRSEAVVASYAASTGLQGGEIAILSRIGTEFRDKRILDVGVGGGRTTAALVAISDRYIGIDISPEMIDEARRRFPSVSFAVCDARALARFANEAWDLVWFSYNGIDSIGHSDRLRTLSEIHRVLAPGGAFVFSSHSRRGRIRRPWNRYYAYRNRNANPLKHPGRFFQLLTEEFLPDCRNHLRNRRHEIQTGEFAIVNDEGHHFGMLTYYITIEAQIIQIKKIGFEEIEPVDLNGNWLSEAEYLTCSDTWIYYLCRKGAGE